MKISGPLIDATFVERPNRFLTIVEVHGHRVESHLPDPGRLKELLTPGARLKVRPVSNGMSSRRKTNWTTVMVRTGQQWVSIDTTLPNRIVEHLLKARELPMLAGFRLAQREVNYGHHRFDFLLENNGQLFYLEVKSVTLVENGVAMFPDAVTERGARHMVGLSDLVKSGTAAGVLFVCQRSDVTLFRPQWRQDPTFARTLVEAEKRGVKIWAIACNVSPSIIGFRKEIPYDLTHF